MLNVLAVVAVAVSQPRMPVVTVTADDTRVTESCVVRIAPGAVIGDANGDGVIHIGADGITVAFEEGSILRGAGEGEAPDGYAGIGVRVDGRTGVRIENARVAGYKVGIRATDCDGLTIAGADLSGNYRQRLKSTPAAEDGSDWLWPHKNDGDEWTNTYGAALSIKNAEGVTLHDITVRRGQNGIILDRVRGSRVYDNDCSFLSGWGLALWRSSGNVITGNALDFCVRGYSHGVYNRGQDSAGLLMFEQCDDNVIAYNSITHGGDGIFGFGGREAIGEEPAPAEGFDYAGRGNRGNVIIGNDLSYAPAHGLEMTFSHGQTVVGNRLVGNAICGIWGGYSRDFLIAGNTFEDNGEMAYGLERGGINMEHASGNRIVENEFRRNRCGVHLWWDNDAALLERPGVKANYRGVTGNIIAGNSFEGDRVGVQIRDGSEDASKADGNLIVGNEFKGVEQELLIGAGIEVIREGERLRWERPTVERLGRKEPVGARKRLAGRANIIMTEWGPWEHTGPFVRLMEDRGGSHTYELFNIDPGDVSSAGVGINVGQEKRGDRRWLYTVTAASPGTTLYQTHIRAPGYQRVLHGSLLKVEWDLAVFPWEGQGANPPVDLEEWRALAEGERAVRARTDRLAFAFGGRGPSDMGISPEVTAAGLKGDYFGVVAASRIPLTRGTWRVTTTSDDGVRVIADGRTIVENWTHHGAAQDSGTIELEHDQTVEFVVEYFEIYGAAVLELKLERVAD